MQNVNVPKCRQNWTSGMQKYSVFGALPLNTSLIVILITNHAVIFKKAAIATTQMCKLELELFAVRRILLGNNHSITSTQVTRQANSIWSDQSVIKLTNFYAELKHTLQKFSANFICVNASSGVNFSVAEEKATTPSARQRRRRWTEQSQRQRRWSTGVRRIVET